jgi:1,4-dihydroxy-6-naphthoate synthase
MPSASLTLAHSGDPDDAFMWWPITGKVLPDGSPAPDARPRIDTGRFAFLPVPGDIAAFNRAARADAPYDITALSLRAWCDVQDRYVVTACGSSFGDGYGPKIVANASALGTLESLLAGEGPIAVPGLTTTACTTMLVMVHERLGARAMERLRARLLEAPFDRIIPMIARGEAAGGLVIHEGQVTFGEAGLVQLADLGAWWKGATGLPLPLGVNAVKRDLDARFGRGTLREIAATLERSLAYALEHREESVDATMPFARANARNSGTLPPTRELVGAYIDMYVTRHTRDIGSDGEEAVRALLDRGAALDLCPGARGFELLRG